MPGASCSSAWLMFLSGWNSRASCGVERGGIVDAGDDVSVEADRASAVGGGAVRGLRFEIVSIVAPPPVGFGRAGEDLVGGKWEILRAEFSPEGGVGGGEVVVPAQQDGVREGP